MLWSSSGASSNRVQHSPEDDQSILMEILSSQPPVSFQNHHCTKEIYTWCYRKLHLLILPPCKVSNLTNKLSLNCLKALWETCKWLTGTAWCWTHAASRTSHHQTRTLWRSLAQDPGLWWLPRASGRIRRGRQCVPCHRTCHPSPSFQTDHPTIEWIQTLQKLADLLGLTQCVISTIYIHVFAAGPAKKNTGSLETIQTHDPWTVVCLYH